MKDEQKPNIIFLDIDGVLNTCTNPNHRIRHFDATSCEFIRDLVEKGCKIVVSSTWRTNYNSLNMGDLLHVAGIGRSCLFHVHCDNWNDRTEFHKDCWRTKSIGGLRGHEIEEWLKTYGHLINNYVIVDDDRDMLNSQLGNFVNTDHFTGFTFREWHKACRTLGYKDANHGCDYPTIKDLLDKVSHLEETIELMNDEKGKV